MGNEAKDLSSTDFHNIANTLKRELTRLEGLTLAADFITRMGSHVQMAEQIEHRILLAQEQEAACKAALQTANTDAADILAQAKIEASRIIDHARTQAIAAAEQARAHGQVQLDELTKQVQAKSDELTAVSKKLESVRALLG